MCTHCKGSMACLDTNCKKGCVLAKCVMCHGYTGANRLTPRGINQIKDNLMIQEEPPA